MRSENLRENSHETSGNPVELTQGVTCNDESLLKACALRQEKLSLCNKNGAARNPHIGYPRSNLSFAQTGINSLGRPISTPWRSANAFTRSERRRAQPDS